jgi:hypothetical protein
VTIVEDESPLFSGDFLFCIVNKNTTLDQMQAGAKGKEVSQIGRQQNESPTLTCTILGIGNYQLPITNYLSMTGHLINFYTTRKEASRLCVRRVYRAAIS